MSSQENHFAEASMSIRKPIAEVFRAFTDPDVTTKFWFTKGSGVLEEGKDIEWTWEMFDHSVRIHVLELKKDERILIQWGDDVNAQVEWKFTELAAEKTFVQITNTGFSGEIDEVIDHIRDATQGFAILLAGAKCLLEHGIELNLVTDKYPEELSV